MDIPKDFNQLTHQQLIDFAKVGFETYWDLMDRLRNNSELNSRLQHISQDVTEMQKVINRQNQELYENQASKQGSSAEYLVDNNLIK